MGKEVRMFLDFYGPDRQKLSYSRGVLSSPSTSQFRPLVHEDRAIHSMSRMIQELKKVPIHCENTVGQGLFHYELMAGKHFLSLIDTLLQ